jgi:hypothetical protein
MNARSTRLGVEQIEGRLVPSTVAYGDFNHDGRQDVAAITSPTTVTVSLANPDGSYTVSATLTVPKNRPVQSVYVQDRDGDGYQDDIVATGNLSGTGSYAVHIWLGNDDGTFGARKTDIAHWPPHGGHGGTW